MFSKTDIEKYFFAEKHESFLFLMIGAIAILLAMVFYFFLKNNFYKGAAIPLLLIGSIQLTVGYSVYTRSDDRRIDNVYAFDMNPGKLKNEELPRMKTVNKKLVIHRWAEIALITIATGLIFYYKANETKVFLLGIGAALAIQSAFMLGADYFAGKRAKIYMEQLENFTIKK